MTIRKPATIGDVATLAGVAIKTVSRVLNDERYVAAGTRARVEEAVRQLAYRPSLAARALSAGRSRQIALLCDNPNPHFLYAMQAGARARCRAAGWRLVLQPYDRRTDLRAEANDMLAQLRPDGVILTPPASDDVALLTLLRERGVPVVCVSPADPGGPASSVRIDNEAAAHAMVTHLLRLGHRRIGFVEGHPAYAASAQRRMGARRALAEAGVAWEGALAVPGRFDVASGREGAAALMALTRPPTAIFAASDDTAAGVLAWAHEHGLSLPGDLSVAGFDRTEVARLVWPPLTSIAQPFETMATQAVSLLVEPPERPEHRLLPFELVLDRSTATPGGG